MSQIYRLFGKKNQDRGKEEIGGVDWNAFVENGRPVALLLVKQAAASSLSPGLNRAASITLYISNTVHQYKGNNTVKFALLGDEIIALTAVFCRALQKSLHQAFWPKEQQVIDELVTTLNLISQCIAQDITTGDEALIDYHRRKLGDVVTKFETAFNSTIKASLEWLKHDQQQRHRNDEHMSMQFSEMQIDDPPGSPTPPYTSVVRKDERVGDILAAAERNKEASARYLSGGKDSKKKQVESDDDDDSTSENDTEDDTTASRMPGRVKRPKGPEPSHSAPVPGPGGNMTASMPGFHSTLDAMGNMSSTMGAAFSGFPGYQNSHQTSSPPHPPPYPYTQSNTSTPPQPNYVYQQPQMYPYAPHHANSYPPHHQSPYQQQHYPHEQQFSHLPHQFNQANYFQGPGSPLPPYQRPGSINSGNNWSNVSNNVHGNQVFGSVNSGTNWGNVTNNINSNHSNDYSVHSYPAPARNKKKKKKSKVSGETANE